MNLTDVEQTGAWALGLGERAVLFLPNLLSALAILVVGLLLAGWLSRGAARALGRSVRLDPTIRAPIVAILKYLVVIMTAIMALGQLGVQMTSLLAVLGAAGLAVGLALQGTLTNIAAGIMLLWLRPFRVGDYIETAAVAGTVREIGLFVSHLETFDGIFVFAPNSTLWNVWMRNHSRAAARTLAWTVTVPRAVSFDEARTCLEGAWPQTGAEGALGGAQVFLDELTEDKQVLVLRGEVGEGGIGGAQHRVPQRIRALFVERFGADGEPHAVKRLLPDDRDPARFMRAGEAPPAHRELVNHRPEAPRQGTAQAPEEAAGSA